MKQCLKCKQIKPVSEFYLNKLSKDGYSWWCKRCQKEYSKEWKKSNPEKVKVYNRKWEKKNPERIRGYYQEHRNERLEYSRRYRNEPEVKEKRKIYDKQYRQRSEVKKNNLIRQRKWTKNNPFLVYKHQAEQRKLEFDLTFEQFMTFWQKSCYYCGLEIKTIRLDRIDNKKGYTIDNCVSCCWCCNQMKKAKSQADFLNHCHKIAKLHPR